MFAFGESTIESTERIHLRFTQRECASEVIWDSFASLRPIK